MYSNTCVIPGCTNVALSSSTSLNSALKFSSSLFEPFIKPKYCESHTCMTHGCNNVKQHNSNFCEYCYKGKYQIAKAQKDNGMLGRL